MIRYLQLLPLLFLLACGSAGKKAVEKPVITVSILPQKTFVEKIAGDDFQVNVLVPPGASPATYSLLPAQMTAIARSAVWFRIGHIGFEYAWADKVVQTNPEMKVYDLSEGLDLIAASRGTGEPAQGIDPHVWLSPANVKKMARQIRDVLTALQPEHSDKYQLGYLQFIKEIDQTNVEIRNILKEVQGRKMISFHPSFSYFARDYGLEQLSIESGGKEPTPAQLARLVNTARAEQIRVVYIQSEFDLEHARVFAREIGGEIVQLSPLSPDWADNLLQIARVIRDNCLADKNFKQP